MTLSLNFCLKSYFVAFKSRFISNVVFRITHFEKRALICKLLGKHFVFRYFEPVKDITPNVCKRTISAVLKHASAGVLVISETKTKKVAEDNLKSISTKYSKNLVGKKSRAQYTEKDKIRIFPDHSLHGNRQAVRHFAKEFLQLNENSIEHWTLMYKAQLVQQITQANIVIRIKRGRPTLLPSELDEKLSTMIKSMRVLDTPINIRIARGVLIGLVCSNAERYG